MLRMSQDHMSFQSEPRNHHGSNHAPTIQRLHHQLKITPPAKSRPSYSSMLIAQKRRTSARHGYRAEKRNHGSRKVIVGMPVVLRNGPYRFFFYSGDRDEPQHVHVARDNRVAKFWLNPVRMQISGGMRRSEIRRVQRIIAENDRFLIEAWNDYFDD